MQDDGGTKMNDIKLKHILPQTGEIVVGCMRFDSLTPEQIADMIDRLAGEGILHYDHADIYGNGICEEKFGQALQLCQTPREQLILQSKCGIREGYYDLSREYILDAVDRILARLQTGYLDLLILHRPDALMEPSEIAAAFDELQAAGKVRYFGVSNFTPGQIELLESAVHQPLLVNQLQLSIPNSWMMSSGLETNMPTEGSIDRDGHVLDSMQAKGITIQTWSPLQFGDWEGTFLDHPEFPELNRLLEKLAEKYGVSKSAIAAAWILRHPAGMQVVTGSSKTERILDMAKARNLHLTRKEWYALYQAAGHRIP
ncbi:aldo/keto reductase family oxidoreductase [uncultured Faecalibaculum sp.]|uniref:aldo/keto reductase n=1 Tax=uncultured Faecalibaculum sp. TaxID=1729681 RepID=UPI0026092C30|nr:aldo/keto reductase [uncultured Faecalibaculum sp.]